MRPTVSADYIKTGVFYRLLPGCRLGVAVKTDGYRLAGQVYLHLGHAGHGLQCAGHTRGTTAAGHAVYLDDLLVHVCSPVQRIFFSMAITSAMASSLFPSVTARLTQPLRWFSSSCCATASSAERAAAIWVSTSTQ